MNKQLLRWILLPVLALLGACTQERQPCLTLKTALLNINFVHYRDTSTVVRDTALPRAYFVGSTVAGLNALYYKSASSVFTLSLDPGRDTTRWLVTTDSLNYPFDTLDLVYTRQLNFLSNACGYTCFFKLTGATVTHNNIDSVLITDPGVTNNAQSKNLKIFIHRAL
ncbi:MAG: hypothetical protein EBZ77_06570 [Chitinophagia bacterium]|nr:hypothetical protein [Chitinophagia bacterium]